MKVAVHRHVVSLVPGLMLAMALASTSNVAAQTDCLRGKVMLELHVNGTVELCSQYLEKIPELQKQLDQLQKTVSGDQELLRELTRSARSVNALGRNIDNPRQVELLQSFSHELQNLVSADQKMLLQQSAQLADKLNTLQDMITQSKDDQQTAVQTMKALNGQLGDAVARLDLSRTENLLDDIRRQLNAIGTEVGAVHSDTSDIKKDTSEIRKAMVCTSATAEALRLSLQSHLLDQVTQNLQCRPENGSDAEATKIVAQMFDRDNFSQSREFLEGLWKTSLPGPSVVCSASHQAIYTGDFEGLTWLFSKTKNATIQNCNEFNDDLVWGLALLGDAEIDSTLSALTRAGLSLDFDQYALFRVAYKAYMTQGVLRGLKTVCDTLAPATAGAFHAAKMKVDAEIAPGPATGRSQTQYEANIEERSREEYLRRLSQYCPAGRSYCPAVDTAASHTGPPKRSVSQGVFVDRETNLRWTTKASESPMSWRMAVEYCKDLRLERNNTWRLPQIDELMKVFDTSETSAANCQTSHKDPLTLHIKKQIDPACGDIWSSKHSEGMLLGYEEERAWIFDFSKGRASDETAHYINTDFKHYVLCVHSSAGTAAGTDGPLPVPVDNRSASPTQAALAPAQTGRPSNTVTDQQLRTEIATVTWVAITADTCGWKLPADQDENMHRYMAAIQAWEKFNPKYWLNSDIAQYRSKINPAGRIDFRESPLIHQKFQERAATLWPKGTVAAPPSK